MIRCLTLLAGIILCSTLLLPAQALALPTGLRPLGISAESARATQPGRGILEAGVSVPQWDPAVADGLDGEDARVWERWKALSVWPSFIAQVSYRDQEEWIIQAGPLLGLAYRMPVLSADAPWGNEYVRCVFQAGGGFHFASFRPGAHVRLPIIYERDIWAFHVIPGGYYLFNDQPIADVQLGLEARPWSFLQAGVGAQLRMDTKKITPQEGVWSFGAGVGLHLGDRVQLKTEWQLDNGLPEAVGTKTAFRVEYPGQRVLASVTVTW